MLGWEKSVQIIHRYSEEVGKTLYEEWQNKRMRFTFYPRAVELIKYLRSKEYRVIAITDGTATFEFQPQVKDDFEFLINPQNSGCFKTDGSAYDYVRVLPL